MSFLIVVPVFNAERWIQQCLQSIVNQTERGYRCAIYDDASTDGTGTMLDSMKLDSRFHVIHNETNLGALANLVAGFQRLESWRDPDLICVTIDGDDWLANDEALRRVRQAYERVPGCQLTYGNCVKLSQLNLEQPMPGGCCQAMPSDVVRNRSFRKHPFFASHLRTFKSRLWNNLWERDLRDPITGEFCRTGWDVLMMIPMLEMAGDRFQYIEDTLYIVNDLNPLNDAKIHLEQQGHHARRVKKMPKYPLLQGDRLSRVRFGLKRRLLVNPFVLRLLRVRHRFLQRTEGRESTD